MSDKPQHSPEPWMYAFDYDENDGDIILGADDSNVAIVLCSPIFGGENYPRQTVIANADRIAACVNACDGFPTTALELLSRDVAEEHGMNMDDGPHGVLISAITHLMIIADHVKRYGAAGVDSGVWAGAQAYFDVLGAAFRKANEEGEKH